MNRKQETMRRVEERLRQAAPPVPQDTRSVWPAVQERLQTRQRPARVRVRLLLWAGAGLVSASFCIAAFIARDPQPAPHMMTLPAVIRVTTIEAPAHSQKHVHRPMRVRKETVAAARPTHPHPSHIAFKRPIDTSPATQSPLPEADNTPRLRPASAVPRPISVKPVD